MISIVVAMSTNNVIGVRGELPWRQSGDLQRFKRLTMGKPIVMGRRTYESIGRPLPGRKNIVITRQAGFNADGCDVVTSPGAALVAADPADEIMIIGGGEIYQLFLPKASRLYLTRVATECDGDAFFPSVEPGEWTLVSTEAQSADVRNEYPCTYETYERVNAAPPPG